MLTANVTSVDVCHWCCSHPGLVLVSLRPVVEIRDGRVSQTMRGGGFEEYGPCPNCELGRAAEERHWRGGYWRGRPTDIRKNCSCGQVKASKEESAQWLEMLARALGMGEGPHEKPASGPGEPTGSVPPANPPPTEAGEEAGGDVTPGTQEIVAPGVTHRCPGYGDRDVPWSVEECAVCSPAEPETL